MNKCMNALALVFIGILSLPFLLLILHMLRSL